MKISCKYAKDHTLEWSLTEYCQIMDFLFLCHAFSMHWVSDGSRTLLGVLLVQPVLAQTVYSFHKIGMFLPELGVVVYAIKHCCIKMNQMLNLECCFSDFTVTKVNSKFYVKLFSV